MHLKPRASFSNLYFITTPQLYCIISVVRSMKIGGIFDRISNETAFCRIIFSWSIKTANHKNIMRIIIASKLIRSSRILFRSFLFLFWVGVVISQVKWDANPKLLHFKKFCVRYSIYLINFLTIKSMECVSNNVDPYKSDKFHKIQKNKSIFNKFIFVRSPLCLAN